MDDCDDFSSDDGEVQVEMLKRVNFPDVEKETRSQAAPKARPMY